jgi:hypothetical protein
MGVATTETCQFHISSGKDSASFIRQVVRVVQEIRRLLIISPEFVTSWMGTGDFRPESLGRGWVI